MKRRVRSPVPIKVGRPALAFGGRIDAVSYTVGSTR
jgi:hypothetical protein